MTTYTVDHPENIETINIHLQLHNVSLISPNSYLIYQINHSTVCEHLDRVGEFGTNPEESGSIKIGYDKLLSITDSHFVGRTDKFPQLP